MFKSNGGVRGGVLIRLHYTSLTYLLTYMDMLPRLPGRPPTGLAASGDRFRTAVGDQRVHTVQGRADENRPNMQSPNSV